MEETTYLQVRSDRFENRVSMYPHLATKITLGLGVCVVCFVGFFLGGGLIAKAGFGLGILFPGPRHG